MLVEHDAGTGVEHGSSLLIEEVGGDNSVFGVAEDALEFAFGSFLHGCLNLFVGGSFLETAGQVNHRNVSGGDAQGHAREFALQRGDHFTHSLGSTGGRRDDVAEDGTAAAPVFLRRAVNGLLGCRGGVDRRHETFHDAEVVMNNLGKRSQAVGRAGSVGDDGLTSVFLVVDAHDEHRGVVL